MGKLHYSGNDNNIPQVIRNTMLYTMLLCIMSCTSQYRSRSNETSTS